MRARLFHLAHLAIAAWAITACQGVIGALPDGRGGEDAGAGTTSGRPTSVPGSSGTTADGKAMTAATVGPSALRRLGQREIENTLRDLLPTLPTDFDSNVDLPADNDIQLAFSLPGSVSDLEVKRFMDLAETVIASLGTKGPHGTFDCAGADETTCARTFVRTFGKRAFRRPLGDVEVSDLMDLYTKLRTDSDMSYGFRDALGIVVEAMLQSPGFLYRWERGLSAPIVDGALVWFDDYEIASRLSYFLWNSMPDDALMAAADTGGLRTPEQVAAQATRLLRDPRTDKTLGDFVTQWLELGPLSTIIKDNNAYPAFDPSLIDSMRAESVALARDVLRGPSPTIRSLLTAPYTFVDGPLAKYYGVVPAADGRVDLTGTSRLGLLTQGALMSVKGNSYRTSPVRRGKFILNRLLCVTVPPPPPNVVPELPPPDPSKTLRQQMAEHRANPSCAQCHAKMDPLGFAYEHFDGAGNFRKDDNGHEIDASGTVTLDGKETSFQDARALAVALASSPQVHECFTRQWLRYAIDRFEQPADVAAVNHLTSFYEEGGLDTRALIVELTQTLPFSHRAPGEGEDLTP